MFRIIVLAISLLQFTSSMAKSEEAVIIEVRKKLKLHDMERVYADYFIRGGTKLGLNKGVLVSVMRRVPVHDPFENASVGDFKVKVADIEIIESDSNKSIGRLVEIDRRNARPMLTYDAIMIGDRLDLDSMRAKVAYREAPASVFDNQRQPASENISPEVMAPVTQGQRAGHSEKTEAPVLTKPQR